MEQFMATTVGVVLFWLAVILTIAWIIVPFFVFRAAAAARRAAEATERLARSMASQQINYHAEKKPAAHRMVQPERPHV